MRIRLKAQRGIVPPPYIFMAKEDPRKVVQLEKVGDVLEIGPQAGYRLISENPDILEEVSSETKMSSAPRNKMVHEETVK